MKLQEDFKMKKLEKAEMIENYVGNIQVSLLSAFKGFAYKYIANTMEDIENLSKLERYKDNPDALRERAFEFDLQYTVEMIERVSKLLDTFIESMEEMDDVTPADYNNFINELLDRYFTMSEKMREIIREV